ncbi:hypothetical protein JAAARDRAFT_70737 [Jaapia argillacea MUCL 33604]|uniref:Pinin/SDK/MemA protein domain-containing protein n=1 Tax=Jaapia argillacea MUCL 33604 TaxID=933084 RepID=A0A067PYZ1_9AGAM|nr:hypothetical protein JAAARDRAFT_70737 [Jaapia argillacea MUCL 33604]
MSSEEPAQDVSQTDTQDAHMHEPPSAPAAMAAGNKKRPRLDLNVQARERKRGKSMFGILVGTLNKAKIEEKEKSASEAAKKRQLLEQRLQAKLRKETDSVRRAEEAKKDKMAANRKEEELQLRDSIHKLRRTRLPMLSHFLCTSDQIPSDDLTPTPTTDILANPPRSHPPPIFYLPAVLTPAQESFINRRRAEVKEAAEKEWLDFREERQAGIEEIKQLRQHVAEFESQHKAVKEKEPETPIDDSTNVTVEIEMSKPAQKPSEDGTGASKIEVSEVEMEVDDSAGAGGKDKDVKEDAAKDSEPESKEEPSTMQADDEDAVEY